GPVFILVTFKFDNTVFHLFVIFGKSNLVIMPQPHKKNTTSGINDTFQGNGYFLKYITQNFKNTLVLATEISKIYCDELTGTIFPEVVHAVEKELKELIPLQAKEFEEDLC
ncbi:MAG: hypothetical protein AAGH81_14895, partial [Bacteroidota bacterium]